MQFLAFNPLPPTSGFAVRSGNSLAIFALLEMGIFPIPSTTLLFVVFDDLETSTDDSNGVTLTLHGTVKCY